MAQTQADEHDVSIGRTSEEPPPDTGKKQSRTLWIIILVFIVFVVMVFLTERKGSINWVEDYHTGIELAKQQKKPALLCFFKQGTRFSSDMWQGVYNKPEVQKYVEANFIPVLIDVDKQPEIASRYGVTYYPTHYVEYPGTKEIDGPFLGSHRLFEFIKKPRNFTEKKDSP